MINRKFTPIIEKFFSMDFLKTLLANAGILLINLITGIITARFLQPEGRGIQAAIILWPQFFAYTLTFGLGTAIIYRVNTLDSKSRQVIAAGLILSVIYGSLACLIGVFLVPILLHKYATYTIKIAQCMMLFAPLIFVGTTMVDIMRAVRAFSLFNVVRFISPAASLVALICLRYANLLNPYTSALAMLCPAILVVVFGGVWISRTLAGVVSGAMFEIRGLFKYGIRAYGSDVISTIADQLDKVVVIGILTAVDLGLYGVALSFSRMINAIQTAMTLTLLPSIVGESVKIIKQVLKRAMLTSFILSMSIGIFMFLLAKPLILTVFGNTYIDAVNPFRILILEAIILGCNNILSQAFIAFNKPGLNGTIMIIALCSGIPCLYFFSSIYGLLGVSLGILVITSIRFIVTTTMFINFTK